jgi:hypothetical protein
MESPEKPGRFSYIFGDKDQFDLGLRLQHLSNAGIEHPNPGVNFVIMRLGYRY